MSAGEEQGLVVTLTSGVFAVPIAQVDEILRMVEITPLPGAPSSCLGVIDVRQQLMPVLELSAWLGGERTPRGPESALLIAHLEGRVVAFAIDEASQVVPLPLLAPLAGVSGSPWLKGSFVLGDLPCSVVDLGALVASADAAGLEQAQLRWAAAVARQRSA